MLPMWQLPPERIKTIVDTNILGSMYGSRVAIRGMLAQGHGQLLGQTRPEPVEGRGFDRLNQLRHDLLRVRSKISLDFRRLVVSNTSASLSTSLQSLVSQLNEEVNNERTLLAIKARQLSHQSPFD